MGNKCEGSCEHHNGEVRKVHVSGWGTFNYCDTAIKTDRKEGFIVTEDDKELTQR